MNVLSLISILLFLIYLQAGVYVLYKSVNSKQNILFFLLSICFSVWSFAYIFVYSAQTASAASAWDSAASLGYTLFPAFMVGFNMSIGKPAFSAKWQNSVFVVMLAGGVFFFLAAILGYWKAIEVYKGAWAWHFVHDPNNIYYYLFYVYIGLAASISFLLLIKWRLQISDALEKRQFNIYFYPLLLFVIVGVLFDIVFPAMQIDTLPNMAHISSLPWIGGITFAMIRYRLLSNNVNSLASDNIIKHIKEIVIFIDTNHEITRTNVFTEKLLAGSSKNIVGKEIEEFFENRTLLVGYLKRANEKGQIGPMVLSMKDLSANMIETSLYFIAIYDRFEDLHGYIIYGHDNREAINLHKEIFVREHAEKNLRAISEVLEIRVKERTAELTNSYKELQVKMTERMRVEEHIKADIAEKEVLINEIHTRVKNNMNIIISLITANDKENLTPAASRKFKELARRVKSLLLVHNNLYLSISYSDVDFGSYIRSLSEELLDFYKRKGKVEIRYEVSDVFLDVDYAIPMGLIVNELLSNALQHAFSDYYLRKYKDEKHIIHVTYTLKGNHYEITVSDNGKGLPKDFDISELTTNGLPLTEILVNDQINGHMEVLSSTDGSMFKITFYADK
ncbi:MAG: hypothetical protein EA361_12900 [Bacteroidetes bacterium]|nr:MAG: hypothetical protein EA361_12900 [Bacteroidota bacterium]